MKTLKIIFAVIAAVTLLLSNNLDLVAANQSSENLRNAVDFIPHQHDENCDIDHGLNLPFGLVYNVNQFFVNDENATLSVFPNLDYNFLWDIPPTSDNGLTAEETAKLAASLECCFNPQLTTIIYRELHTINPTTGECSLVKLEFMDYCSSCYQINEVNGNIFRTITANACLATHR
ncbi:MAG: hypothetical protein FWG64_07800 [Firmicutes bacterium]|nr:hypothetical protein [Bacillota bacterium]